MTLQAIMLSSQAVCCYVPRVRTVITHSDIRNYLLQYCLPFRKLPILGLRCLQLGAEFLCSRRGRAWSARRAQLVGRLGGSHLYLASLEEFRILACLRSHVRLAKAS